MWKEQHSMTAVARMRALLGTRLGGPRKAAHTAQDQALNVGPVIDGPEATPNGQLQEVADVRDAIAQLRAEMAELKDLQTKQLHLSRAAYDDIGTLRQKLLELRRSEAYAATFENRNPLVSVPIATYNAAESLVERAIASVRAQTYDRWEIVIVGDGCTDDTETRIRELGDSRVRFVNLPFRTLFPDQSEERWMVSGAAPANRGVELSRGDWIAPLDDDDEFLPDHLETLLNLALDHRAEYVYGGIEWVRRPGVEHRLFSFPPEHGKTNVQAALYLRALNFFEWDTYSWTVGEPADWNLIRRMREAGVIMAATEAPVVRYYPSMGRRV